MCVCGGFLGFISPLKGRERKVVPSILLLASKLVQTNNGLHNTTATTKPKQRVKQLKRKKKNTNVKQKRKKTNPQSQAKDIDNKKEEEEDTQQQNNETKHIGQKWVIKNSIQVEVVFIT